MSGKLIGIFIMVMALIAGLGLYYLQVYHFYDPVSNPGEVELTSVATGAPEAIIADGFSAIDAGSSPIRYRGCFTTPMSQALLTETYELADNPVPLNAPAWFDCFDAETIGDALETGAALAFLGEANIAFGIDRLVAIFDDGRGFIWNQINSCGAAVFDGQPAPEGCPSPDDFSDDLPDDLNESN